MSMMRKTCPICRQYDCPSLAGCKPRPDGLKRFVVHNKFGNSEACYVFDRKWSEQVDLTLVDSELAKMIAEKLNERLNIETT